MQSRKPGLELSHEEIYYMVTLLEKAEGKIIPINDSEDESMNRELLYKLRTILR